MINFHDVKNVENNHDTIHRYLLLYTRSNLFEDLRFKQFNPFTGDNSRVIQRAIKIAEK